MTVIKSARVETQPPGIWHPWFLKLRIDDFPEYPFYEKRDNCYFAEVDGWVSFHAYSGPGRGFGGAVFRTPVKQPDGSIVVEDHIGPWSSSCSTMSKIFKPCISVLVHTDKYSNMTGSITAEFAKKILQDHNLDSEWKICQYDFIAKRDGYQIFPRHIAIGEQFAWNKKIGKEV